MRKIYIVLAHTGTLLSSVIKLYTRNEFSHSSIALDSDLQYMYSFGRLNPYNPFIGGFVHEYIDKGTFKRFSKTRVKVYEIEVTDKQYNKINRLIKDMEIQKEIYKFNVLGLFAVSLKVKLNRKNYFYCAEFVKHILEESNTIKGLPEIIKPEDFKKLENKKLVYSGLLKNYKYNENIESSYSVAV